MTNSLSLFFVMHVMLIERTLRRRTWHRISSARSRPSRCGSSSPGVSASTRPPCGRWAGTPCGRPSFPLIMVAPVRVVRQLFDVSEPRIWILPGRCWRPIGRRLPRRRRNSGKLPIYLVVMCLKGSAIGALSALPFAMCADVIDLDTARNGPAAGGSLHGHLVDGTQRRVTPLARQSVSGSWCTGVSIPLPILATRRTREFALLMLACTYSVIPALVQVRRECRSCGSIPLTRREAATKCRRRSTSATGSRALDAVIRTKDDSLLVEPARSEPWRKSPRTRN